MPDKSSLISAVIHDKIFLAVLRGYIITTPRQWISPGTSQLCVFVIDAAAPAGSLNVSLTVWDSRKLPDERNQTIYKEILNIPAGEVFVFSN